MWHAKPKLAEQKARLENWLRDFANPLRQFLWARLHRHDVVDDLLQEVFTRAWQSRDDYREEGKSRAYLFAIADRLVIDWYRQQGQPWQENYPLDDLKEMPAAVPKDIRLERDETQVRLREAIAQLSPAEERTILLRYYGEFDFKTIAEILNCPLGTVLSHCRRGLRKLRSNLVEEAV